MHTQPTPLRHPALALAALTLAVSAAWAAPAVGPSDNSFYNPPANAPTGKPGDLIQYRATTVKLGADAPATHAWNVIYQSTDSLDKANAVSGTVIVPTTPWAGSGPRPVMLYAIGTHGLANGCAPSRQFEAGTDYEAPNIVAALKAGYAVLAPDYAGYLNGQRSTFLAGKSQGQASLDLVRAALSIPTVGFTSASKIGIWGFSQGGQTAAWAGELLPGYAPDLLPQVVGVAAGGIPADFNRVAHNLDGNLGFPFLASAVSGLGAQYPNTIGRNFNLLASADGKAAMTRLQGQCLFEALFDIPDKTLASFTNDPANTTLDDILGVPAVDETLRAQNLGSKPIPVPLYHFHGQADEIIPLDQDYALKKAYCAKGTVVAFDLYPSEHIVTMTQSATTILAWMADRLAGKPAPNTCNTAKPDPQPTANPGGGNFVVTLDKWKLDASVGLRTLGQTVTMPPDSTLTATADVTAKTLKGQLNIPDFKSTIKLIGLPLSVGLKITPAGDVSGTSAVDSGGLLHVHGTAPVNITVASIFGIPFGECKTVTPVSFPIDFDGPVASLGNGNLTFAGTTAFPQIKGCIISAILSTLMSGNGQTYKFTVSPPAPVSN
ncbi:MAG: lipase family protein [Aquabacterium sp.]